MEVEIQQTDKHTRELTVTVPWLHLEGSFEQTVSRFRQKIHLPGFRKGKVPRKVLFKNFGAEIEADFAQTAIEEYYLKALEQNNMTPVSQAKIDPMVFSEGKPLTFTATFEVEPLVVLPDYQKKFKVKQNVYIPDDEDVDIYIEDLRRQYLELKTVETGSEEAHILLVDMQELDHSGLPIVGRKVQDRYLKVGEGVFGGENLNRLKGLRTGDTTVIEVIAEGSNDPVKYELAIKNVQEEILPELNEEFIRDVDESATNESEFRGTIMKRIESNLKQDSLAQLNESIIDYFLRNTDLEVPASMVEKYVERASEEARGGDGEKLDQKKFKEEIRPSAVRNLKWYMIRRAIVEVERLEVSEEEVGERINQIVENSGENKKEVRRFYRKPSNRDRLRDDLTDETLFDRLRSFAEIEDVKIHTKDLRKQRTL